MSHIVTVQDAVTAFADWIEPTDAELDAIEEEMPAILADVDLLDAQIITLDRIPSELDARRIRRARRRVLAASRDLVNRTAAVSGVGARVPRRWPLRRPPSRVWLAWQSAAPRCRPPTSRSVGTRRVR
jgi:hypothetical protein